MKRLILIYLLILFGAFGLAEAQTANGEHQIALSQGWNLVSSYRAPQFANLTMILTDINNSISMLTLDGTTFYTPTRNYAGNWNPNSSYSVYMAQADVLHIYGDTIPLPHTIQLFAGANRIGYPKRTESSVSVAFAPIINYVICIGDGQGHFFIPALGVNTLETLSPGKGYTVYVSESCSITFQ